MFNLKSSETFQEKQQFYLVSVIADKLIYFTYITRTNFRSDIVGAWSSKRLTRRYIVYTFYKNTSKRMDDD